MELTLILPTIASIISNVLWGSTFMASKVLLLKSNPITILIIRFLIAALGMFLIGVVKKNDFQLHLLKKRYREILLLGLIGYTGLYYFQIISLKTITSSQSASIMLLAPVFTLVGNSLITKKMLFKDASILLVSLAGAILILQDKTNIELNFFSNYSLLVALLSAFFLGISVLITKKLLQPTSSNIGSFSVFNVTFHSLTTGLVGLLVISIIDSESKFYISNLDFEAWGWLVYLGLICSVLAFLLWNWSIKYISSSVIAISMYLKTPVALGIGAFMLSEKLSAAFYLGTLLILSSLFFNQIKISKGAK